MVKTHALDSCPTCGARGREDFDFGDQRLCRCAQCRTVYAAEYGDPSEIYKDGYLFGETDFGIDVRAPQFQAYLAQVCDRRARLLENITGGQGSLLDVGCGTGEFAEAAVKRGWRVQGVEPEATGAEMARNRGVDVRTATLEESGLPEGAYDVVTAFHVLEHVPDGRAFLRALARWARPGGHVVVEVPNFRSVVRRRTGAGWVHLRPLEHLIYLEPATLRGAFERAGLEPVAIRTPTWVTPPQSLDEALWDLAFPPIRWLVAPLGGGHRSNGGQAAAPGRAGWPLIRAVEALYDRLRVGMVVLGVARVSR